MQARLFKSKRPHQYQIDMRSFKDITADEEAHALALHKEAVVIDASLVGYTDYVGEDLWVDDLLGGGITASNATVCMGTQLGQAQRGQVAHRHLSG
ncbi:MAG: hypothetical protein ACERKS_08945 [Candidatus Bathyarchaeota archaeon]